MKVGDTLDPRDVLEGLGFILFYHNTFRVMKQGNGLP